MRVAISALFFIITVFCVDVFSQPSIENAGAGCPDNFCIWISGKDWGTHPVLYIYDETRFVSRYSASQSSLTVNGETQSLTLMLRSSEEMDLFESKGLILKIVNTDKREFSTEFFLKREGPLSVSIKNKKATLPLKTGGSNYVVYDIGNYLNDDASWADPKHGVKSIFAHYHKDKIKVNSQIQKIANSGQKVISFVFWYFIDSNSAKDTNMHMVNVFEGIPTVQYQNALEILKEIKKYNFEQVILRLAPQGNESAAGWSQWDENNYKKQWFAIDQLIQLFKEELKTTSAEPIFDLSGEGGGIESGFQKEFTSRLWKDYVSSYGLQNTSAFSISYYPGRLANMVKSLDSLGLGRPPYYSVDIYSPHNGDGEFYQLAKELESIGELDKPIMLQETYYNNAVVMQNIMKARLHFGLNIVRVIQWNAARENDVRGTKHFSALEFSNYEAYKSLVEAPTVLNVKKLNSNPLCFHIVGSNFTDKTKIYTYDYFGKQGHFNKYLPFQYKLISKTELKLCIATQTEVDEWDLNGLSFKLENENYNFSKEYILNRE